MLRSTKELYGYKIEALDGTIGKVDDFFFDDKGFDNGFVVRYLVADIGSWLADRRVLISPVTIGEPDWSGGMVTVKLKKKDIESSPPYDADKPVSRQHEIDLHNHYGWPFYWTAAAMGGIPPKAPIKDDKEEVSGDPHLRSIKEVMNYHIQAEDDQEVGHVEDFMVDDISWILRYMVVDTRNWLPGKKVLVAPPWIETFKWSESKVYVDLKRDTIKDSPPFAPEAPINRKYEEVLYDFYGRPRYWVEG
jgi:hypothetical protein